MPRPLPLILAAACLCAPASAQTRVALPLTAPVVVPSAGLAAGAALPTLLSPTAALTAAPALPTLSPSAAAVPLRALPFPLPRALPAVASPRPASSDRAEGVLPALQEVAARAQDPKAGVAAVGAAFDGAAAPASPVVADDLPPAGPVRPLTRAQRRWLFRQTVSTEEDAVFGREQFKAFVLGGRHDLQRRAWAYRRAPQEMKGDLYALYRSLQLVALSGLPASERAGMLQTLGGGYARALERLSGMEMLSPVLRRSLSAAREGYLSDGVLAEEFLRQRQLRGRLDAVENRLKALSPEEEGGAREHEKWTLLDPIPEAERGKGEADEHEFRSSLSEFTEPLAEKEFFLEKAAARLRLAERFSPRLRAAVSRRVETFLAPARKVVRRAHQMITRIPMVSMRRAFLNPLGEKQHRVIWIPRNENLRLRQEKDGWVLEADMETDIRDPRVAAAVKASIEDYWKGEFDYAGRKMRLRTVVRVRVLAPSEDFSKGALKVTDDPETVSHASKNGFQLDHILDFATPAHEFGHVLGLGDEYREGYDPVRREAVYQEGPDSLMATLSGRVLPRHLKAAWWLLRRGGRAASAARPLTP